MRALVLRRHGGIGELEVVNDYPAPKATAGHVVIRVRASPFNYHDVFTVKGMPGIEAPLPVIIGLDMAGEIIEVGPDVQGWKPGDRVLVNPLNKKKGLMGEMLDGGMAEQCLVAADQLLRMPPGVRFEDAAALPVAYGTAHRMLVTHKTVLPGQRVLVLGASGGVGTGCVILAKLLGAEGIAWGSRGGKVLVCGAPAGHDPKEDLRYIWSFELQVIGSNSFYDDNLVALMDLIHQGTLRPVVGRALPREKAAEGLRLIQGREVIGKVVVTP